MSVLQVPRPCCLDQKLLWKWYVINVPYSSKNPKTIDLNVLQSPAGFRQDGWIIRLELFDNCIYQSCNCHHSLFCLAMTCQISKNPQAYLLHDRCDTLASLSSYWYILVAISRSAFKHFQKTAVCADVVQKDLECTPASFQIGGGSIWPPTHQECDCPPVKSPQNIT